MSLTATTSAPVKSSVFQMFRPLPLPKHYRNRIFKMPVYRQLIIAGLLNLLSLALPIMMLQVYDRIIPHQSFGSLAMLAIGVLAALIFDITLRLIRSYLMTWSAASNEHMAGCAAMEIFATSDLNKFELKSSGEHLQSFTALNRLREFYSGQAWTALIDLPFAAIFLALIYYLGGQLVWVPAALLAVFFLEATMTGKVLRNAIESRSESDDRKASYVVSVLKGIHTVKSLSYESFLLRKFEVAQADVSRNSYRVAEASGSASIMSAAFGQMSLILTATFGLFLVLKGDLSVGALSACTLLAGRCIQPVQRVLATWLRLQDLSVSRVQANELFTIPTLPRLKAEKAMTQGRILIDNVNYAGVLDGISLEVMPGEIIAITGESNTDKSILLQIICGLLKPDSGSVTLDTINPIEHSLSDIRHLIGYLPQDGAIFKGSILENITGFQNDERSLEIAREAGRDLGLDTIIDLLPRGYQTPLTDSASDPIPPGVKQRIALARVLAHKPAILLFDEADRALDKDGYNLLFRMTGRLKGKTTIILVTQDQNLLSFADKFFHLENGILSPVLPSFTQNIAILSQHGGVP